MAQSDSKLLHRSWELVFAIVLTAKRHRVVPRIMSLLHPKWLLKLPRVRLKFIPVRATAVKMPVVLFAPECGTPLWSISTHAPYTTIKLGALDEHSDLKPNLHIYVDSAAPWHLMHEGLPTYPKMPPFSPEQI